MSGGGRRGKGKGVGEARRRRKLRDVDRLRSRMRRIAAELDRAGFYTAAAYADMAADAVRGEERGGEGVLRDAASTALGGSSG